MKKAVVIIASIGIVTTLFLKDASAQSYQTELGGQPFVYSVRWVTSQRVYVSADLTIPASRQRVWNVLTDYNHLSDFIPYLSDSHVVKQEGTSLLLHQEGTFRLLLLYPIRSRVTFRVEVIPKDWIRFEAVEGDFQVYRGSWQVKEIPEGTRVSYQAEIEPAFWIPRWMLTLLERHLLTITFRAILERCLQ
jgi:ribosome-associated toxin RatA of RatAB toxin-antitoxin module